MNPSIGVTNSENYFTGASDPKPRIFYATFERRSSYFRRTLLPSDLTSYSEHENRGDVR